MRIEDNGDRFGRAWCWETTSATEIARPMGAAETAVIPDKICL